eukprot:scaffold10856_cov229-Amphora_coffeaeformis.AAC.17
MYEGAWFHAFLSGQAMFYAKRQPTSCTFLTIHKFFDVGLSSLRVPNEIYPATLLKVSTR